MPRTSPLKIILIDEQRAVLESRARKYTSSYIDVVRAKIALYAAEGMENKEIAARLDMSSGLGTKVLFDDGRTHYDLNELWRSGVR